MEVDPFSRFHQSTNFPNQNNQNNQITHNSSLPIAHPLSDSQPQGAFKRPANSQRTSDYRRQRINHLTEERSEVYEKQYDQAAYDAAAEIEAENEAEYEEDALNFLAESPCSRSSNDIPDIAARLEKAQQKQLERSNTYRQNRIFEVGEKVVVRHTRIFTLLTWAGLTASTLTDYSHADYIPILDEQLTFKRKKFNISSCYNSEASFSKQQGNNLPVDGNDVFNMLKTISTQLQELSSRVDHMERKKDRFLKENIIQKSEEMAQQKTVRECKVLIRKVHQSVCRLTGEEIDNTQTEIASTLPLITLAAALEMEEKLKCEEFATATKQFVLRMKGSSDSDSVHLLFLLSNILYDSFITCGLANFEQQMRKSIEMSHHRFKQKKYRMRKAE
ncbi:uncharacterized protein LOC126765574 [Bactrocera neohumeralis]|uniref:uncharacterized protein LOC126765574 n=1 Tax=Bactrocera neohumeralis TaxID=98809 RepID=UPI0021655FB1|nr:uncharacterized protein LOC126765574 [Bactrocera neohumeralis]